MVTPLKFSSTINVQPCINTTGSILQAQWFRADSGQPDELYLIPSGNPNDNISISRENTLFNIVLRQRGPNPVFAQPRPKNKDPIVTQFRLVY